MMNAFAELGYEVIDVTGYSAQRIPRMKAVIERVRAGERIEFCYAENVNSPMALSDPSHLPTHPLADPCFFRSLRSAGIPTGIFYRDIHWRFPGYREALSAPKWLAAMAFHRFDLAWYSKYMDVVFLPDMGMAPSFPGKDRFRFRALPPGAPPVRSQSSAPSTADGAAGDEPLRLMYVGAISAPNYDITPLLVAAADAPGVALTVCCPEAEIRAWEQYPADLRAPVELVHLRGEELAALYRRSDLSCLVYGDNPYRDFAMPVKLFESIGHHTPIISNADTAAGRFITENLLGWTFGDTAELVALLRRLAGDRSELTEMRAKIAAAAPEQSWLARARTAAEILRAAR